MIYLCYNYDIEKVNKMDYRKLIKELREKLILSQEEMAIVLDVSFTSINRWENGKTIPTIKARRKIVKFCKKNKISLE